MVIEKLITYIRNKYYVSKFNNKVQEVGPKKIINWQYYINSRSDRTDTLHTINFTDSYSIMGRGIDLDSISETCVLDEYTKFVNINKGDIVFDIGSCVGDFAILAASKGARVFAFEPNPSSFEILLENIKINNLSELITPLNIGIGPKEDNLYIETNSKNMGGSSIVSQGDKRVKIDTISNVLKEYNINKIDLLKIDVEGYEYEIFSDSEASCLDKISKIVGEYHLLPEKPGNDFKLLKKQLNPYFKKIIKYSPYYFFSY